MPVLWVSKIPQVKDELGLKANTMLRMMVEDVHEFANPKTPLRENPLRTQVLKIATGNKGTIEWRVPYAEVQERGWRYDPRSGRRVYFQNYTTPGTGAKFAEYAVAEVFSRLSSYAERAGLK